MAAQAAKETHKSEYFLCYKYIMIIIVLSLLSVQCIMVLFFITNIKKSLVLADVSVAS